MKNTHTKYTVPTEVEVNHESPGGWRRINSNSPSRSKSVDRERRPRVLKDTFTVVVTTRISAIIVEQRVATVTILLNQRVVGLLGQIDILTPDDMS